MAKSKKFIQKLVTKDTVLIAVVLAVSAVLFFQMNPSTPGVETVAARVTQIDDDSDMISGWLKVGGQEITARILSGPFRGREITVQNSLVGNLMFDRYVRVGDRAIFTLSLENGKVKGATLVDYDRQIWHLSLFVIFAGFLILFARSVGIKAVISFIFTTIVLVSIGIPLILAGNDPLVICLTLAILFGVTTLLLVGGFSLRTLAAVVGFFISLLLAAGLTVVAGKGLRLGTAVSDTALTLFYSGHSQLDISRIFFGAVILGASGAMLDIAISIATAVREVARANPTLGSKRLILAGFEVGRAALGTMTTTLLLAYVGCSLFLFLVFAAQTTHFVRIINFNLVSAEILRTLAGSIGMVMIAPITAVAAGLLYRRFPNAARHECLAASDTVDSGGTGGNRKPLGKHTFRLFSLDTVPVVTVLIVSIVIFLSFGQKKTAGSIPAFARVIQMEDHTRPIGFLRMGMQSVTAQIVSGPYKGQQIRTINQLLGRALTDRYVRVGDKALFMLDIKNGRILSAKIVDYERQSWHLFLFIIFAGLLILFSGYIGIRAFVSFVFTVVILLRLLFPFLLVGHDPFLVCFGFAIIFGIVTLLLVGGVAMRTLAAIIGFTIGVIISAGLTVFAGYGMYLRGITSECAVFLLQSGYPGLDLTKILLGSIVLGASGAMVDIAISVATSVREVAKANPMLGVRRLIFSGFEVGRAELGTMTTTLLMAYMSVNIFLVMIFAAKGTSLTRVLNITMVSHEILRIIAGSIGMVMIAPITAVAAGLLYHSRMGATHMKNQPQM
jgi:uncharacterized membrane protein